MLIDTAGAIKKDLAIHKEKAKAKQATSLSYQQELEEWFDEWCETGEPIERRHERKGFYEGVRALALQLKRDYILESGISKSDLMDKVTIYSSIIEPAEDEKQKLLYMQSLLSQQLASINEQLAKLDTHD